MTLMSKWGDKISKIVFETINAVEISEVDNLDETGRGDNGFGSTGVSKHLRVQA